MNETMLNTSLSMIPEDILPSAWVGHLPFAFWLIEEARPNILVELGTHNGTSFLSFCQAVKERGTRTKAFAVDTWEGDEHAGQYGDEVHGRLDSLVKAKYAGFAQLMRMLFDEATPYFSDGSIDLLHIDGLHTYEAVKHDFETWLPKMSRRGVVIFHDTMVRERGFGVWQLWEELRERYPYFEFKHTHGLGVLLVGDQPPKSLKALCSLTGTPHEAITSNTFDALGQRFSLLEKISQLDARNAVAVQHAANYQGMYESSDASLRHAMNSFGSLLEGRHRELEAASLQIAALSASIDSLAAGLRSQVAGARRELELPASPADAGAPDHALNALVHDIKARGVDRQALHAAVEEAQSRLAQALAASESQLESATRRMHDLQHRHASELAALVVRSDAEQSAAREAFDLEREAMSQVLQASAASLEATRQQMDQLRARHGNEASAAAARYHAEQSAARAAFDREREAMSHALRASEVGVASIRRQMDQLCALHVSELAAVRAGFEADLLLAGTKRQADVSELIAQIRRRDEIAQDLGSRLTLRQNEVLRLVGSKSWRITAPIRWLRGRWAALGKRTRAPTYAEVLDVPLEDELQARAGDESAPSINEAAARATYLQELFADTAARHSPDYLGATEVPAESPGSVRAIALYHPQLHCSPENEAWWAAGLTEWTHVTHAVPQFIGHGQPQVPADLGFYDLRAPEVFRRQVDLARSLGIQGFCFHHYWSRDKRLLEQPLELFLAHSALDFPFCLCWANEDWTGCGDGREDQAPVAEQHGPGNDAAFILDIERYLRDPRYIRVDGRPLLVVYRASLLSDPVATLEIWRRHCRDAGIGEIFVAMVQFDLEDPSSLGFDAAVGFPSCKLAMGFDGLIPTMDIVDSDQQGMGLQGDVDEPVLWTALADQTAKDALALLDEALDANVCPPQFLETAVAAVDPQEHLTMETALDEPAAMVEPFDADFYLLQYPDIASAGVDPYEHYVSNGKAEGRHAVRPRLEISEGGIAFDPARETVLVLAHEASRTGAPMLSLNLVTSLNRRYNVIAMLLGDGPLTENFRSGCTWLVGPLNLRGSPARATVVIDLLMAQHRPKFAVANSVESRVVLEPLARHGVATVSLVHEFAAYTRPRDEFRSALLWAHETVFSTPLTRENAHIEFPEFAGKAFTVLPQGRCSLPTGDQDEDAARREDSRLLAALRPRGEADDDFVILGAGFIQQRKGVDLFIQCAGHVIASERGKNCRFVWIGSGYDPERDLGCSVYLADQLRRSGLDKVVRIIDETARVETAYRAADVLLLTSRLDPLPNVAIDAMAHGLPVVCFDKSSGIAGVLAEEGLRDHLVAGYLDVHDMANKVLALASSATLRQQIRELVLDVVDRRFSMDNYVAALERLALDADARLSRRALEVDEVVQSGLFRPDFHASRKGPNASVASVLEFEYLRSWDYGIDCRKPFPGFHPGVYRNSHGLAQSGDPLVDFLRAGRPSGPWLIDVISPQDEALPYGANGRIALHLHVYYPDMLPGILARLAQNLVRPDLYISIPDEAAKAIVEPLLADYDGRVAQVQVVPNRGRDIGPFLTAFASEWSAYDAVGHLHTKKSPELNDPALSLRWNEFLMENLLGGSHRMADTIVGRLLADPGLGLVFPDDPHVMGWCANRAHAEQLGHRLGLTDLPAEFNFPIGTMFWARPTAIASLIGLRLQWDDYPDEPLGYDGTILHAIERLVPSVVLSSGFRYAVTNVPGVTR